MTEGAWAALRGREIVARGETLRELVDDPRVLPGDRLLLLDEVERRAERVAEAAARAFTEQWAEQQS